MYVDRSASFHSVMKSADTMMISNAMVVSKTFFCVTVSAPPAAEPLYGGEAHRLATCGANDIQTTVNKQPQ